MFPHSCPRSSKQPELNLWYTDLSAASQTNSKAPEFHWRNSESPLGQDATRADQHKHCLPCPTFVFALPSWVHSSSRQTACLPRPLQFRERGPEINQMKGEHLRENPLLCFCFFTPESDNHLDRITGSRNNNPQLEPNV